MREEEEKMEEDEDGKNQGSSSTWDLGRTTKRETPLKRGYEDTLGDSA
jgi:hypothetical protein